MDIMGFIKLTLTYFIGGIITIAIASIVSETFAVDANTVFAAEIFLIIIVNAYRRSKEKQKEKSKKLEECFSAE